MIIWVMFLLLMSLMKNKLESFRLVFQNILDNVSQTGNVHKKIVLYFQNYVYNALKQKIIH